MTGLVREGPERPRRRGCSAWGLAAVAGVCLWSGAAVADQCAIVSGREAEAAHARLRVGDTILLFCEPCGQKEPWPRTIETVAVEPSPTSGFKLRINGEAVDIAYVYVPQEPGRFANLGMAVNCGVSDVRRSLRHDPGREAATAARRPPERLVERFRTPCPRRERCCRDGRWAAANDVPLMAEPRDGAPVATTVRAGARLEPLSSEVHIRPEPVTVVHDHARYRRGDVLWLLESLGHGSFRVWYRGKTYEEDMAGISLFELKLANRDCQTPSHACWGRAVDHPQWTWWVRLKTREGIVGWARAPEESFEPLRSRCG